MGEYEIPIKASVTCVGISATYMMHRPQCPGIPCLQLLETLKTQVGDNSIPNIRPHAEESRRVGAEF